MKKVLFTSLLLVSVFLIGSSGVALAQCSNYQDYTCSAYVYLHGENIEQFTSCVELCYDDGFGVGITGPSFTGYLYPIGPPQDQDYFLGTFSETTWGFGGCFLDRQRKRIHVEFSFIQDGGGVVDKFKCKECDDCCSPE
jgi:hypothetical protein